MFKFFILSIIFIVGCEQQENKVKSETKDLTSYSDCENIKNCLRIPLGGRIKTIDPGIVNQVLDYIVVDQLFVGLTALEKDTYNVIPALATSWKVSEDGKVYTFILRQDMTWNDGNPLTASDFVWTIRRNLAKETKSS
ncbi:MAG: hypothetical protein KAG43_00070, partial [Candidatus Marithrix sp.]|nr:hypothetical protein [Candidatus Marithrix sp.]